MVRGILKAFMVLTLSIFFTTALVAEDAPATTGTHTTETGEHTEVSTTSKTDTAKHKCADCDAGKKCAKCDAKKAASAKQDGKCGSGKSDGKCGSGKCGGGK